METRDPRRCMAPLDEDEWVVEFWCDVHGGLCASQIAAPGPDCRIRHPRAERDAALARGEQPLCGAPACEQREVEGVVVDLCVAHALELEAEGKRVGRVG